MNSIGAIQYHAPVVFQSRQRSRGALLAACTIAGLLTACGSKDDAPPLATVSLTLNKTAAALGSPIDLTYRFRLECGLIASLEITA